MARNPAIVVRFASNVRDFLKGADQVEDALQDLALESGDLARDVDRDTDRMARSFREAGRKIDRASDGVKRDTRQGFGDAGKESGREFVANLGEGIGSGELNAQDVVLGTIGGLASVPVLGAAVAAGGAVAVAFLSKFQAQAEKLKALGSTAFEAYRDGILEASERDDALVTALGVEDLATAVERIRSQAELLGVPFADLYDYLQSGDTTLALESAMTRIETAADKTVIAQGKGPRAIAKQEEALKKVLTAQLLIETSTRRAAENAVLYRDAVAGIPSVRLPSGTPTPTRPGGGQRLP